MRRYANSEGPWLVNVAGAAFMLFGLFLSNFGRNGDMGFYAFGGAAIFIIINTFLVGLVAGKSRFVAEAFLVTVFAGLMGGLMAPDIELGHLIHYRIFPFAVVLHILVYYVTRYNNRLTKDAGLQHNEE